MKTYNIFVLIVFCLSIQNELYAQCDTCTYTYQSTKPSDISAIYAPPAPIPVPKYFGCPVDSNKKINVAFVHGLGGSIASWHRQVLWTDTAYKAASFGVDYTASQYEVSFAAVATEVNNDLGTHMSNGIDQTFPNRCKLNDFVISHSQGGIASRYLDRQWDINTNGTYGNRKFYGIVTVGTPNAGADIAYTKLQHYAFVQKAVSTVYLVGVHNKLYDLTTKYGWLFGQSLVNGLSTVDTLIRNKLAPVLLGSVHANTLDEMRPDDQNIIDLNNHNSNLRRVAFYGIEDAPECWRVMDNIHTRPAEEYPLWGAQPDDTMMMLMEDIRADHESTIQSLNDDIEKFKNNVKIPLWGLPWSFFVEKHQRKVAEREYRQSSLDFLNNANTEWRYLIGSYHRDSFYYQTETYYELTYFSKYGWWGDWFDQKWVFGTYAEADNYYNNLDVYDKKDKNIATKQRQVKVRKFYPSDGVVLERSQRAYPEVKPEHTDKMDRNNHFQERNSSETKRVLEKLYLGGYDVFFKVDEQ